MKYLFPRPSQDSQEQNVEIKAWKKKKKCYYYAQMLDYFMTSDELFAHYYWDFSFVIAYAIDLSVYCEQAFYEKWLIRIII